MVLSDQNQPQTLMENPVIPPKSHMNGFCKGIPKVLKRIQLPSPLLQAPLAQPSPTAAICHLVRLTLDVPKLSPPLLLSHRFQKEKKDGPNSVTQYRQPQLAAMAPSILEP